MTISEIKKKYKDLSSIDLEVFLLNILDCDKSTLFLSPNLKLTKNQSKKLEKYIARRLNNEPVAYIINQKEFYGLNFYVNKTVLIPRPETEELVDLALKLKPKTILDLGTGSGCIACSLAKFLPNSQVTAIDICKRALTVAVKNADNLSLKNISFLQSDIFSKLKDGSSFDLIITNPPYIKTTENSHMSTETLLFEPKKALFAGDDGLDIYKKIFSQLKAKNITFNHFLGEFGFQQKNLMLNLLENDFSGKYTLLKDLAGITRFVHITK